MKHMETKSVPVVVALAVNIIRAAYDSHNACFVMRIMRNCDVNKSIERMRVDIFDVDTRRLRKPLAYVSDFTKYINAVCSGVVRRACSGVLKGGRSMLC